jgi:hypothetical protein
MKRNECGFQCKKSQVKVLTSTAFKAGKSLSPLKKEGENE